MPYRWRAIAHSASRLNLAPWLAATTEPAKCAAQQIVIALSDLAHAEIIETEAPISCNATSVDRSRANGDSSAADTSHGNDRASTNRPIG